MSTVSEGADTARLHEIATQIEGLAEHAERLGTSGATMVTVLGQAWSGQDAERFAHDWSGARHQLDATSDLLRRMGAELNRQAEDQSGASEAKGGPPVTSGPGRGESMDDPDDERNKLQGLRDWFLRRDRVMSVPDDEAPVNDPGEGNVTLPEGADPDNPAIKELLETPRGRETLQWMSDNDIAIRFDEDMKGGAYYPDEDIMVLGPKNDDAETIIHEASHAQWDETGKRGDVHEQGRAEYVETQLNNETEAVTEEIYYDKERRASGESVPRTRWEKDYDEAYVEAIEAGKSEDEADDAGRGAVKKRFADGEVVGSNSGKTYPTKFKDEWRAAHS